jgi:hypothetical protein
MRVTMRTTILACRTIADELNLAQREAGCDLPVSWVESGLHNWPDRLRTGLQRALDEVTDADRVLLAFGYCGNSVIGLTSGAYELIVPRADDCISLLLGSCARREQVTAEKATYFLTPGYLEHESNIWSEYQAFAARRGKESADSVYAILLKHYRRLGIIDTGSFDVDRFVERTLPVAATFGLEHEVIPGTTQYLQQLLTGPWDEGFIRIGPRETLTFDHVYGPHLSNSRQQSREGL